MDEQRASLPLLPGLNSSNPDILRRLSSQPGPLLADEPSSAVSAVPDENFFEMLMRCQVRPNRQLEIVFH